ncbi:MAG: Ldh family oxidoreductase [Promethearchaeota archaeon]
MADGTIRVDPGTLERFMKDAFVKMGVPEADAATCAKVLIASDLRGVESHGIGRLKYYYDRIKRGQHEPVTRIEVVKDTPVTAVWDGHHGMGHVIAHQAMAAAIEKARAHGLGAVAVRNSTHFGIAGYYVLMAVEAGMIGVCCTNARPSVAPTHSTEPLLGTNPLTFGFPTDEEFPFVFDAATSIVQRGKIEMLAREGKPTPPGYVVGEAGEARTDTPKILEDFLAGKAALLPLGGAGEEYAGYKGYDFAAVVELLSCVLCGGTFLRGLSGFNPDGSPARYRLGHLFVAINPEFFVGLETCKELAGRVCRTLRSAKLAPGATRVYTAGEKEYLAEKMVREKGVPINPGLQADLRVVVEELGIEGYDFLDG